MIVITTLARTVFVLALVLLVVADSDGIGVGVATAPLVGILPASTGTDTSPVSARANTKRFMLESPLIEYAS